MEKSSMTQKPNFDPRQIIDFLSLTARLKSELRHCTDATGKRAESVAEHCFQMSLFALLVHQYLEGTVDVTRLLKLCISHDLVEAIVGDTPYVDGADRSQKRQREENGLRQLIEKLPPALGLELHDLWHEFEDCRTPEARCAKALDNLEAQLQHNIAPLSSWEEREFPMVFTKMDKWCNHDAALKALCETIKQDACVKMEASGIDPSQHMPQEIKRGEIQR
jgi:putative hydrolase of HD superfamily